MLSNRQAGRQEGRGGAEHGRGKEVHVGGDTGGARWAGVARSAGFGWNNRAWGGVQMRSINQISGQGGGGSRGAREANKSSASVAAPGCAVAQRVGLLARRPQRAVGMQAATHVPQSSCRLFTTNPPTKSAAPTPLAPSASV